MKKYPFKPLLIALICLPLMSMVNGQSLSNALHETRQELRQEYVKRTVAQRRLLTEYEQQHEQMIDIIKKCNELSLQVYSQKQEYTFDLTFAMQQVTNEFNQFNASRRPYDRVLENMSVEMDRYARLIETLRRLPPEIQDISNLDVADSLLYRNELLDQELLEVGDNSLSRELEAALGNAAFLLDQQGQQDRDSCLFYASELLKMYADHKDLMVSDSTHYQEAYLRLKESYDYVCDRYQLLQKDIFVHGQTPWWNIFSHHQSYFRRVCEDFSDQYGRADLKAFLFGEILFDNSGTELTSNTKGENTLLLLLVLERVAILMLFWVIVSFLLLLLRRLTPESNRRLSKESERWLQQRRPMVSLLLAVFLYMLFFGIKTSPDLYIYSANHLIGNFFWLLAAIVATLLIRVPAERIRSSFRLYLPTMVAAILVIACRVSFMPNSVMNYFFPPALVLVTFWQAAICLRLGSRADNADVIYAWISLAVTGIATVIAIAGYIVV